MEGNEGKREEWREGSKWEIISVDNKSRPLCVAIKYFIWQVCNKDIQVRQQSRGPMWSSVIGPQQWKSMIPPRIRSGYSTYMWDGYYTCECTSQTQKCYLETISPSQCSQLGIHFAKGNSELYFLQNWFEPVLLPPRSSKERLLDKGLIKYNQERVWTVLSFVFSDSLDYLTGKGWLSHPGSFLTTKAS